MPTLPAPATGLMVPIYGPDRFKSREIDGVWFVFDTWAGHTTSSHITRESAEAKAYRNRFPGGVAL